MPKQHSAELIAVGTELLLGSIANTDAQMLSQRLAALGISVFHHSVVGDNPARLRDALSLARTRADIIITTGGLGPTCDDLTKTVVAEAFGLELAFDEDSAARVRAFFQKLHPNVPMTENNLQQAFLPRGCTIFKNDWGTAPGCAFEAGGVHVLLLPGPPRECTAMFEHCAAPYLAALSDGVIFSRTLKVFGVGESAAEGLLRLLMGGDNPTLAPYAKEGEVELRLTASAPTEAAATRLIAPLETAVRMALGDLVYGTDGETLPAVVLHLLRKNDLTLGTAESCTGGLVAKLLTDLRGSSSHFVGGIVSYSDDVKRRALGVSAETLGTFGAVSPETAKEMAIGARRALGCNLAIATTGIAGPDSDSRSTPVGLVYLALAGENFCTVKVLHLAGTRERIRGSAALHALEMLRRHFLGL